LSAFSLSVTQRVYRYLEQRTCVERGGLMEGREERRKQTKRHGSESAKKNRNILHIFPSSPSTPLTMQVIPGPNQNTAYCG
jgi:hypothetical protein